MKDTKAKVLELVSENTHRDIRGTYFDYKGYTLRQYGVDSLDSVDIQDALEKHFKVEFDSYTNLLEMTPVEIGKLIEEKLRAAGKAKKH